MALVLSRKYRAFAFAIALFGTPCWMLACGGSAGKAAETPDKVVGPPVTIEHEPCDVTLAGAIKMDVNNDGRADLVRVKKDGREICRVVDLNFDGIVDTFWYFDEQQRVRRRESDFDRDGRIDEIALYRAGIVYEKHRETNLDGKLDVWDTYVGGRLTRRLRDSNGDGKVDQWWSFPDPQRLDCPIIEVDNNSDGKPDDRFEPCRDQDNYAAQGPALSSVSGPSSAAPPSPTVSGTATAPSQAGASGASTGAGGAAAASGAPGTPAPPAMSGTGGAK